MKAQIGPDEPVDLEYFIEDLQRKLDRQRRDRDNALANFHRDPARRHLWRDAVLTAHRAEQRTANELAHTRARLADQG